MSEKNTRLRQRIISGFLALLILGIALYFSGVMKSSKKEPKQTNKGKITNVIYAPVVLKNASVSVQSNGILTAKNKINIVSRTQGVFENSDRPFRGVFILMKAMCLFP